MFACVIVSRYASARGIVGPPWGQRQVRRRGQTKSAAQGSALSAVDFPSFADTALVNGVQLVIQHVKNVGIDAAATGGDSSGAGWIAAGQLEPPLSPCTKSSKTRP